jgi:hypothetical protein
MEKRYKYSAQVVFICLIMTAMLILATAAHNYAIAHNLLPR